MKYLFVSIYAAYTLDNFIINYKKKTSLLYCIFNIVHFIVYLFAASEQLTDHFRDIIELQ